MPPSLELPLPELPSPLSEPLPELDSSGPPLVVVETSVVPEDSVESVVLTVVETVVEAVALVVGAVVIDVVLLASVELELSPPPPSVLPHPAAIAPMSQSRKVELLMDG